VTPVLLDLFCGEGGCSRGYVIAGFDTIGVDTDPVPPAYTEFIGTQLLQHVKSAA
jgi:DNA (cytosine-5)-methyltransferase 1